MEFEKRKSTVLASLTSVDYSDKSPKGSLDIPIISLIHTINTNLSYFTTSSCSGRISILSQPFSSSSSANKKKARGGSWLFITHEPADLDAVVEILFGRNSGSEGDLVFRFEPFIVAVECKDVGSAQELVSTAISCGFRESGITSIHKRIMVAIRCSIRLEVPLGATGQIMVSPEYIRFLVGIANEKMLANRKRTDNFLQVLQSKCPLESTEVKISSHTSLANQGSSLDLVVNQLEEFPKRTMAETEQFDHVEQQTSGSDFFDSVQDGCCMDSVEDNTKVLNVLDIVQKTKWLITHAKVRILRNRYSENSVLKKKELLGAPGYTLPAVKMTITEEPVEKLFLWGHSACTVKYGSHFQILVFGGFGGLGRHGRRDDSLFLNPLSGMLKAVQAERSPSPRMGHTSSAVGDDVFVIGGRGDPTQILNEVWVLHAAKGEWELIDCTGSMFHPRHRHAAAIVGSRIYVFGGLNNDIIYSCMHVLDIDTLQWSEISNRGEEWPCARHSHSLVASATHLFMFGGYDGENVLGDLYSFDVKTCIWKKEKTTGQVPFARFSHSMFIYNYYLGIVGGCPIKQHSQVALLDLRNRAWMHVKIHSISKDLLVRCTTTVIGDDLIIVGGGASCYAFGTKFNEPMTIDLHPLVSSDEIPSKVEERLIVQCKEVEQNEKILLAGKLLVLQLERKYGKLGKDILKKLGWLDLGRKVYSSQDGVHIFLPILESSLSFFQKKALHSLEVTDTAESLIRKGGYIDEISVPLALNILFTCEGSVVNDDVACVKRPPKSSRNVLKEAVASLIEHKGLPLQLLDQLPTRWERLGDIVVLPVTCFKDPIWDSFGEELWHIVAESLGTCRLARQGRITPNGTRDSTLEILVGDNGWVSHHENGIIYSFDATKCMFSSGNLSEKLRMACLDCRDEIIVDLFAGIGYFVLPFLVKAKAKQVYACEWNPHAIEALRHNIQANSVADRCILLEGDNRNTAPRGVADRVCLGLLPTSESSWLTAVKALRSEGGILHVHGNVKDSEEGSWADYVAKSIASIAKSQGYCWDVSVQHLERVKWYGPHVCHLVADIRCSSRDVLVETV